MKQIIPFSKEIVFKTTIASITSMSLEHEEKVYDGEISGDFIIFGDYKIHSDTTEKEMFKYRLPFTTIIPDNINKNSVVVDIVDFTYYKIEDDVLKVNISFSVDGEEIIKEEDKCEERDDIDNEEKIDEDLVSQESVSNEDSSRLGKELDEFILEKDLLDMPNVDDKNGGTILIEEEESVKKEEMDIKGEMGEDYVTYHIHIVKEGETLDTILREYNTNIDYINEYNNVTNINVGDKIIIPLVDE